MTAAKRIRRRVTLGSGALMMVGIGTAALIGLPGMSGEEPPEGVLEGSVLDPDGGPVEGSPVALFDGRTNALLEVTHTDAEGRYGFQQDPGAHHVHALAPPDSNWIGAWSLDRESGQRRADLRLAPAHLLQATVRDEAGQPVTGAEVRVYARGSVDSALGVVSRARTDARGMAHLRTPDAGHVAAFSSDLRHRAEWAFDRTFAEQEVRLDFTLRVGHPVRGTVVDESGRPLEGILVTSWEDGLEGATRWNGYQLTGDGGTFLFIAGREGNLLRAVDRKQRYLPAQRRVSGSGDFVLVLGEGEPQEIRCTDPEGRPTPARVWAWSEAAGAWSWGTETGTDASLTLAADARHAFVIESAEQGLSALESYGQIWEPGVLEARFHRGKQAPTTEE